MARIKILVGMNNLTFLDKIISPYSLGLIKLNQINRYELDIIFNFVM